MFLLFYKFFSDVVLLFVDTLMILYGDLLHDTWASQNECSTIFPDDKFFNEKRNS